MDIKIKLKDISFSKFSAIDTFGKVFYYDDKIYRLISDEYKTFCLEWFSNGLIDKLNKEQLIPYTSIETELKIEENPDSLILRHERLRETYIGEWSFTMIKTAALTILKLNQLLNEYNYELKDSHPYNILFKGRKALWVDLGSISFKKSNAWVAADEFIDSFYIPLKLWESNEFYFLNKALNDKWFPHQRFLPSLDIRSSRLFKDLQMDVYHKKIEFRTKNTQRNLNIHFLGIGYVLRALNYIARKVTGKQGAPFQVSSNLKPLAEVYSIISSISKKENQSTWSNYHTQYYRDQISDRLNFIVNKCISLHKKSILDLAGNQGLVGSLISKKAKGKIDIITTDYDENALDYGFNHIDSSEDNINFTLINCILAGQRDETIYKRLKSNIVLALAVTHHLILGQGYNLEYILNEFRQFSNEYLLIEFMPKGLWKEGDEFPELPVWYNESWFESKLQLHFKIIEKTVLETNRILYLAKLHETEN